MTATASTKTENTKKRVSPAFHNWRSNIKKNNKMTIIIAILHLVAAPAILVSVIASIYSGKGYDAYWEPYLIIGILTTCLAALMGILAATESFTCLHDKSVVDMKLSLPMTASQRFVSNYLSGLFTYLVPFLGAQVISLLLCGYGCLFMDGKTFYENHWNSTLRENVPEPYVCNFFGEAMPILLKLILGGTLCMLMLYTLTVLIAVCCGSKFESISYTLLVNVIIPGTILCVLYGIFDNLYGISAETIAVKLILFTSVAGGIIATADWASGELFYGTEVVNYGIWALVFFLIIAALFSLSFFLYRKRRAEQVSKPFVFKLAYYFIITCGMFCIISLFMDGDADLIPTIITTAIIYMIFEVVTNRGFKRFWLSIIKYAATFIAVTVIITIGQETNGFGAVQRVPSASSVASIELRYNGFYSDFPIYNDYYYRSDPNFSMPLLIKDRTNIETVVEAHQAAIDCYEKNGEGNYAYSGNFEITYKLKTGGSFTRTYYEYCAETGEILSRLDLTEEYKLQTAERYKKLILGVKDEFNHLIERVGESDYNKNYNYEASVGRIGNFSEATKVKIKTLAARGFFEQLAEAYYNDIMAINEDNYYHSELHNVWFVNLYCFDVYLNVPESFTNTVELLEYFDFGLEHIENLSDEQIISSAMNYATMSSVYLFTDDEWRALSCVSDELPLHSTYSIYPVYRANTEMQYYIYYFDENFCDLMRASMPRNIVEENGYIICMFGNSAAIPADMADIAAGVQRSAYSEYAEQNIQNIVNGEGASNYYYVD